MQPRRGQVGQHALEFAEGFRSLESLPGRFHRVVGRGTLDEFVRAPVIAVRVHVQHSVGAGGNEPQHAAIAVGMARNLRGQVRGHAFDVFHQHDRVLEDAVIDSLQEVSRLPAVTLENHAQ